MSPSLLIFFLSRFNRIFISIVDIGCSVSATDFYYFTVFQKISESSFTSILADIRALGHNLSFGHFTEVIHVNFLNQFIIISETLDSNSA